MSTTTTEQPRQQVAAPTKASSTPLREVATVGALFTNAEFLKRINNAVPNIITPQMMLASLAGSLRKSPDLARCSVADVAGKALMLAQVALPPDTPLQLAHLIPFKDKVWNPQTRKREETMVCQVVLGYHGLLDLAYRSGKVGSVIGRVAWRDEVDSRMFSFEFGTDEHLRHIPSSAEHDMSPQAQAAGTAELPAFAYAQAAMVDGKQRPFEVWPMQKVLAIRNASPAFRYAVYALEEAKKAGRGLPGGFAKAPWVAFLEKMAAKTVAKQLLNWLPRSVEYATIAALDDMQDRRAIDLGPIIDANDYVSAAADAAEMSGDPSTAFGMRGEGEEGEPEQTDQGQQTQTGQQTNGAQQTAQQTQQPAQTKPPAKPKATTRAATKQQDAPQGDPRPEPPPVGDEVTKPSQAAPSTPAATAPSAFEAWLLDAEGETVELYTDALAWARAYETAWTEASNKIGMREQNADAIEDASAADQRAAAILAAIATDEPPAETAKQADPDPDKAEDRTVYLAIERGKPNHAQYLKDFRAAVSKLTVNTYLDFVAANFSILHTIPMSTRSLCVKVLVEQAGKCGLEKPPRLADLLSPSREDDAAALDRDVRAVDERIKELKACATKFDAEQWAAGMVMKAFGQRLRDEGKNELVTRLNTAFTEKMAEFAPRAQP